MALALVAVVALSFGALSLLRDAATGFLLLPGSASDLQSSLSGLGNWPSFLGSPSSSTGNLQANESGSESPENRPSETRPSVPGSFGGNGSVQAGGGTGGGRPEQGPEKPGLSHNATTNFGVTRKPDINRDIIDDYAVFTKDAQEVVSGYIGGAVYGYSTVDGVLIYAKKRSDGYCTYDFENAVRHCEVPVEVSSRGKVNLLELYSVNFEGLEKYKPKYYYSTEYEIVYDITDVSDWNCVDEKFNRARILTGDFAYRSDCTRLTEQYLKVSKKKFHNYSDLKDLNEIDLTKPTSVLAVFDMPISETVDYTIEIEARDSYAPATRIALDAEIGIADCDGLNSIRDDLTADYVLSGDIDCDMPPYNEGVGFEPIGDWTNSFTGTFNGRGHTMSGLYINRGSADDVALFGYTRPESEIKNIGLVGADITGGDFFIGALVGTNFGTVTNCYSTEGVITASGVGNLIGGLVGDNWASITNSYSTGSVSGNQFVGGLVGGTGNLPCDSIIANSYSTASVIANSSVGGLVGTNDNSISNSYAKGTVTGFGIENQQIGGLVGSNYGSINNSYFTGHVGGWLAIGGLAGSNFDSGTITDCYSTGSVHSVGWSFDFDNYIGGLVGINYGAIANCYSTGLVSGKFAHGLVGFCLDGSPCSDSFWDTWTSDKNTSACGTGKTTAEMKQQLTFTNWDFDAVWDIIENVTYPFLREPSQPPTCSNGALDGNETDIDCGGSDCQPCENGGNCLIDADCESDYCSLEGICTGQLSLDIQQPEPSGTFYQMQEMPVVFELVDRNGNIIAPSKPFGAEYRLGNADSWVVTAVEPFDGFGTYTFLATAPSVPGNYTLGIRALVGWYEVTGSAPYIVKSQDLYIEWIKPIQVVEDVPLVAGKDTVVRVKVVNNGPEAKTDVSLDYGGGCFKETKPNTLIRGFSSQIVDFYPPNNCTK